MKIYYLPYLVLPMLFAVAAAAQEQERSFNILLGIPYAVELGGDARGNLSPKGGFVLGVDYWAKNKKGDFWSAGISYNSFRQKREATANGQPITEDETFEYLNLHGMPIVWQLGKKRRWYAEAGGFANFLLRQETDDSGNVTNNAKAFKRLYLGLCAGLGVRLGDPGSTTLFIGLRNDLGLASFGAGLQSLKFNAISLFAGLGI